MAGSLPEPVLLSTFLGMDEITILGQEVVFKHVFYSWIAMAVLFGFALYLRGRFLLLQQSALPCTPSSASLS